MAAAAFGGAWDTGTEVAQWLPFVPSELLSGALPHLQDLRDGAKVSCCSRDGAALLIGLPSLGPLARIRDTRADAPEQLASSAGAYLAQLVRALHASAAEVLALRLAGERAHLLAFLPSGRGSSSSPGDVAAAAARAAAAVQAVQFARAGWRPRPRLALGSGRLHVFFVRVGTRCHLIFDGPLVAQVWQAQRAARDGETAVSPEACALLDPALLAGPGPSPRLLAGGAAGPGGRAAGPASLITCPCGAPLRDGAGGAGSFLAPYVDQLVPLAPAPAVLAAAAGRPLDARSILVLFTPRAAGGAGEGEMRAAELAKVVRAVGRVAEGFGGSAGPLELDDEGASAVLAFGLDPPERGPPHAERAVRAALALGEWFAEASLPLACGVATGPTLCSAVGAPCRREFALIGDSVIAAFRLMRSARAASGAGPPQQEILCDASAVAAAAAGVGPGPPLVFERAAGEGEGPLPCRPRLGTPGERAEVGSPEGPRRAWRASERWACFGREREAAAAMGAVEALARHGRGSTLVVEGEAGMGKTRLLAAVQRACLDSRAVVLRSAAAAPETATALWPLRGILAALAPAASTARAAGAELERRRLLPGDEAAHLWACVYGEALPAEAAARGRLQSAEARRSASAYGVEVVASVASALARLVVALEQGPPPSAAAQEDILAGAAAALGTRVALILDDVQWADSATLFVLRCLRDSCPRLFLALGARPEPEPPRDLLILTGRLPDEARQLLAAAAPAPLSRPGSGSIEAPPKTASPRPEAPALPPAAWAPAEPPAPASPRREPLARRGAQLPPLRAAVPVQRVVLGALSREASRELLESLGAHFGARWPAGALEELLDRADGHPLFLVELCRQHATGPGPGSAAARPALPSSVQQVVLARAAQRSPDAQRVLRLAAVVGRAFTCAAVVACDPHGTPPAAARAALRELRRARLVFEREPGGGSRASVASGEAEGEEGEAEGEEGEAWPPPDLPFDFLHALTRDALYGAVPAGLRAELHGRFAAWLEGQAHPHDAAALALHWRRAGQHQRALPHIEAAARQALASNAMEEAGRQYALLVATLDALGLVPGVAPLPPHLSPAEEGGGAPAPQPAPAGPAKASDRALWRLVRARALNAWATAEYYLSRMPTCRELAMACLDTLGEPLRLERKTPIITAARRAVWLLRAAAQLKGRTWGGAGAGASGPEAEAHRVSVEANMLVMWSSVKYETRAGDQRLVTAAWMRLVELVCGAPDALLAYPDCRAMGVFAVFLHAFGMVRQADAVHAANAALAERLDDDVARAAAHNSTAYRLCHEGRLREGLAVYGRALALLEGHRHYLFPLLDFAIASLHAGRLAQAEAASDAALVFASRMGGTDEVRNLTGIVRSIAALARGQAAKARSLVELVERRLDEAAAGGRPLVARSWAAQGARLARALLAWRAGDAGDMASFAEATLELWGHEELAAGWQHTFMLAAVVDFCQWDAFRAREAAERDPSPPRFRLFSCGRGPSPAAGGKTPRSGGSPSRRGPAVAVVDLQDGPSGRGTPPGGNPRDRARAAAALAARAVALMERTRRRRMPSLAPFCDLARAEAPGLSPARRLALLRAARDGFAAAGRLPFEAAACLRLAEAEPDAAAAAAAAATAERIGHETGIQIPRAGRDEPRGARPRYISVWCG